MPYNPYADEDVGIDGAPNPSHDRHPASHQHQPQHSRVLMAGDPEPMLPPTHQSDITRRQPSLQPPEQVASPVRGPTATNPADRIVASLHPSDPKDDFYRYFPADVRDGQRHKLDQQDQHNDGDEDDDEQISFLGRCPSLNLEFMWRRYHKARARSGMNNDLLSEDRLESLQQEQGFPKGLARVLLKHAMTSPIRCWIIDNSGTMHCHDGHRVVRTNTRSSSNSSLGGSQKFNIQVIDCTRWEEVQSTVLWHAELAAWCQTPLAMRLVHDPGATVGAQQVGVSASKSLTCVQEVDRLRRLLRSTRPSGGTTPLTRHLQDILKTVQEFYPRLSYHRHPHAQRGSSSSSSDRNPENWLTLIICTDGLPTDEKGQEDFKVIEKFVRTLESLQALGVGIVVRLSTDEERVVTFYRTLDINSNNLPTIQRRVHTQTHGGITRLVSTSLNYHQQINNNPQSRFAAPRHLPILDDYVSECQEVNNHNPWLHYGYPLHLCREQGITSTVLEALGHRPLKRTEVCRLIQLVFECDLPLTSLGDDGNDNDNEGGGEPKSGRAMPNGVPGLGTDYEEQQQQHPLQQRPQRSREQRQDPFSSGVGAADYKVFRANLEWYNKQSGLLWNPVKQKFVPWLDLKKLDHLYGKKQGASSNRKGGCTVS